MANTRSLAPSVNGAPVATRPPATHFPPRAIRITGLGILCFLCGTTVDVRFDLGGGLFLIEPLIALLALQCLLALGPGKSFVAHLFLGFIVAGLVTFSGYLLSDLVAANEPAQFLRGWGRVGFLILDCSALMILAAHGRQNIWWLAVGIAVGGIASLGLAGAPISEWKSGYGEFVALLVVALAPLAPAPLAAAFVGSFGVLCMFLDYRSLGAVCLLVGMAMLWQPPINGGNALRRRLLIGLTMAIAITAVIATVTLTKEEFSERRQQSNIGRYAGIVVAWRAITESPLIGYGSWAADRRFGRMFQMEIAQLERENPSARGDGRSSGSDNQSILPHSQILQACVEGGILGIAFFVLYGYHLFRGLHWFAVQGGKDRLRSLFVFLLMMGLWHFFASPFLGSKRIEIAMAVAVIFVAAHERRFQAGAMRALHARSGAVDPGGKAGVARLGAQRPASG